MTTWGVLCAQGPTVHGDLHGVTGGSRAAGVLLSHPLPTCCGAGGLHLGVASHDLQPYCAHSSVCACVVCVTQSYVCIFE